MKTIGITGSVGSGKSAVIEYIESKTNAYIIFADKLASELQSPGYECYEGIVSLLGEEILNADQTIDKKAMADKIFADKELLDRVNCIVHPSVKKHILKSIRDARASGKYLLFIVEAALLIEEKYYEILDELWYIRTSEEVRRERLKVSRGYSGAKIDAIIKSQLTDDEFIKYCDRVIDNSGDMNDTFAQINKILDALSTED